MILQDDGIEIPESYLRSILKTDWTGTDLREIPKALKFIGAKHDYIFARLDAIEELKNKSQQFPSIAAVKVASAIDYHTVLIDEISDDFVCVRDPLPLGQGKSYKIKTDEFTAAWLQKKSGGGLAIVII